MSELAIRDEQHYLATISEVRSLVERMEYVGDAKSLADKARAAQVWAERARLGQDQVNLAAMARLWAERRAGELLQEMPGLGRGGDRRSTSAMEVGLPEGISHKESSRFQNLAQIPADEFGKALETAAENGRVTAMSVHYSSSTSEWSTPQELFDLLDAEFSFDLDVCAALDNAKCPRYFTAAEDGLAQTWEGTCWMNPPYGDVIGEWVRKAWEAGQAGSQVVCLLPARVDTRWWWDYARYGEVRFIKGRLKFGGGDTSAPFPSAVVIFGRKPPKVVWWEAWPR